MKTYTHRTAQRGLTFISMMALCCTTLGVAAQTASYERVSNPRSLNFTPVTSSNTHQKQATAMMFVRFDTPSVVELVNKTHQAGRSTMSKEAQRAHAASISASHARYQSTFDSMGVRVLSSLRVGANGMRVNATPAQVAALRALPGVRAVSPVATHTLDLGSSVGWVGAPAVWDSVGDGGGISIAIIDSGIDYLHSNLGGAGLVSDYDANDKDVIEPGTFPTAKVVGGYDFAGAIYNPSSDDTALHTPTPDEDPLDGNGHGSHVAGISAGIGAGAVSSGVAKGASLYALKVFNDTSGSTNLTSDAIEWALDPNDDGDISDHVDVINMSLGSSFGDPGDPSAISSHNASQMGVIVVASAGNSGDVPYVTGAPAVAAGAISVAASLTGGDVLAIEVLDGPVAGFYEAVEGTGPVRLSDGTVIGNTVVAEPLQACTTDAGGVPVGLDNAIKGGVALVQRGGCSFDIKVVNAQMSGATALVVYNDGADPSRVAPITMGGIGNMGITIEIPAVMITSIAGEQINASITDGNSMSSELNANLTGPTVFGDTMGGFSSRGPGHGGSTFKPDMAAPGVATLSTAAGTGDQARSLSGTSMAAPHVAGAAALMRQAFPDASVMAIKAMLMNATVDAQPDGLIGPAQPLSRQGVGVLRVNQSVALSSYATPAGVSFGRLNPTARSRVQQKVVVTNSSSKDRTFDITHVAQQELAGTSFSVPDSITVAAGQSSSLSFTLFVDASEMPADDGVFSHREIDGWLILNDGVETLRIGYMAAIDPASKVAVEGQDDAVVLNNSGVADGVAEGFTLALEGTEAPTRGLAGFSKPNFDNAAIRAVGYRTRTASDFAVIEFGFDLHNPWESMSRRTIDIYLDVDDDGEDDVHLQATDFSDFEGQIGAMVTAQTDLATGDQFLDWFVEVGDFNDSSGAILFTRLADGGLVPDEFDFRIEVSAYDGSTDVETGSINLADEIVADSASLVIPGGDSVTVETSGNTGDMLWLFQNNRVNRQSGIATSE